MSQFSKPLSELLNLFRICGCCKKIGATRYDSYYCDTCFEHCLHRHHPCNPNIDDAYSIMICTINDFIDRYKGDPEFWNLLDGEVR
jgi:hypothetical protein